MWFSSRNTDYGYVLHTKCVNYSRLYDCIFLRTISTASHTSKLVVAKGYPHTIRTYVRVATPTSDVLDVHAICIVVFAAADEAV
jgi:hypothetical protein